MVIHVQRHANVRKQTTLLDGVNAGPSQWGVCGRGLNRSVHEGMNRRLKCKDSFKDLQCKCKYIKLFCFFINDFRICLSIKHKKIAAYDKKLNCLASDMGFRGL